ncbi:MAG TPA: hypothetical protein VLA37_11835, partial [Sphingomonadaceae bacterium]|nr:hypothetical protein [Sphingomonadaceae bacterium]
PKTPVGELSQVLADALGSYLLSHPPSAERRRRLQAFVDNSRRDLGGRTLHVGAESYREQVRARIPQS